MGHLHRAEKAGALSGMEGKKNGNGDRPTIQEEEAELTFQTMKIGDLCPERGEAAVVNEEGCRKCYACGHSEC